MKREECSVGMEVLFGRPNGEHTLGRIVKCNPAKASIEILHPRGSRSPAGQVWRVPYSMIWRPDSEPDAATPNVDLVRLGSAESLSRAKVEWSRVEMWMDSNIHNIEKCADDEEEELAARMRRCVAYLSDFFGSL